MWSNVKCFYVWLLIYLPTIIKGGLCACYRQETRLGPYLLLYIFAAASALVSYEHSLVYSRFTLPVAFFRPLDIKLTAETYQELIP